MDMQNNGLNAHPDSHVDSSITIVQESENLRASPGDSDLKSIIQIDNIDEEKNIGNSPTASLSDTPPDKGADEISEGRSNPGWLSVIAVFLVNFCVFGVIFSWGIIQNVYVFLFGELLSNYAVTSISPKNLVILTMLYV